MTRISAPVAAVLRCALTDRSVIERYWSHVTPSATSGCRLWTGAISGRGHARFWLGRLPDGRDAVVLGHRFGWGLAYGYRQLATVSTVRHYICDNPLCQTVEHLRAGSTADNSHDWPTRRLTIGSPLRDVRGPLGRARALRAAARAATTHTGPDTTSTTGTTGTTTAAGTTSWLEDLTAAAAAGLSEVDRDQLPLPLDEPLPLDVTLDVPLDNPALDLPGGGSGSVVGSGDFR